MKSGEARGKVEATGEKGPNVFINHPNLGLITEVHMCCMERPQGSQQKATVGSLGLVASHHRGSRIWSL